LWQTNAKAFHKLSDFTQLTNTIIIHELQWCARMKEPGQHPQMVLTYSNFQYFSSFLTFQRLCSSKMFHWGKKM